MVKKTFFKKIQCQSISKKKKQNYIAKLFYQDPSKNLRKHPSSLISLEFAQAEKVKCTQKNPNSKVTL